jgi:hypothetical protein
MKGSAVRVRASAHTKAPQTRGFRFQSSDRASRGGNRRGNTDEESGRARLNERRATLPARGIPHTHPPWQRYALRSPAASRALSFQMTYLAHFGIAVAAGLVVELLVRVFAA